MTAVPAKSMMRSRRWRFSFAQPGVRKEGAVMAGYSFGAMVAVSAVTRDEVFRSSYVLVPLPGILVFAALSFAGIYPFRGNVKAPTIRPLDEDWVTHLVGLSGLD